VFYDYDEIEYLTDCNFRDIPQARNEEDEMASEPWYPIGKHDVFPEQFGTFLLGNPKIRKYFMKHHADLLTRRMVAVAQATHPGRLRGRRVPVSAAHPFPQSTLNPTGGDPAALFWRY
jgi:isocitrate dehydrogenase kinase/phosphatase